MQNGYAARAYGQNARSVGTPRNVEYQAFQRVTAMLQAAARGDYAEADRLSAILKNNQLWATLSADLLSDGNALPLELRAELVSLAEFARKTGLAAMAGRAGLDELIEINTAIMRGLRGDASAPGSQTAVSQAGVSQAAVSQAAVSPPPHAAQTGAVASAPQTAP
ncbi:MAG: flagellar biosynthesis regulator FlaF [Pseudomonadota bacterium]